ncbi:MAG: hypothetical protein AAF597_12045, partial [Bacteroidota bacterium]
AAAAAMAQGAYEEVPRFLGELPQDHPTKVWLTALLALRSEEIDTARELLSSLSQQTDNPYPATELISRLP